MLAACVEQAPHRVALVGQSSGEGELRVTYAELASRAAAVAGGLAALGVGHGDRVGMLLSNDAIVEGHLAVHGCHRLGAIVVPINVRSVPAEIQWCLQSAGCGTLIYEPAQAAKVERLREALPALTTIALDPADAGGGPSWAQLAGHAAAAQAPLAPGDGANWVFTSGTTGYPKIVAHTHENCVGCGIQVAEAWDLHPGDVYLNCHPFFTASGTNTDLMAALWSQSTHVVEPRFSPADTLARVVRFEATNVFWMTPALSLIFATGELPGADLSTVRRVLYGGQAMPPEFHLEVDDQLAVRHGVELVHMIGQSEAGPSGVILDPEFHRRRPGAVGNRGFSRELTEYALIADDGRQVGPGEEGEICFRTPSVMQGYVGAPEASAEVIRDGWLHTGDLCRYDEDGFVFFVDRLKDVIRRGGVNIASAEVERVLRESADVADVAAVPHPHEVLGEVVKVVVVRREGSEVDAEALIGFAAERLADFKVPRVVEFIDELPRNDMGKIQKAKLRG
jgi:acyl-CoA synthetase (AMP-forming)/AMP-acid ligase II